MTSDKKTMRAIRMTGRYTLIQTVVESITLWQNDGATDLRFLDVKSLTGEIFYEITGPDLAIEVVSDFGSGNPWPVTHWICGDCDESHDEPK